MIKKLIIALFTLSILNCLMADDKNNNVIELNPIIVEAESEKTNFQTGDVDTKEISSFYTIITKDDIDGKMEDLADILKKEASIQVYRSSGLGSYSTISIRGSSSDQVMVYMDGILLNDASGGGVDLSNIAISDIESVEIYRGITPPNFSHSSIGGVVNIKTNRVKKGTNASIKAGHGSFNTYNLNTFLNHKPGDWDVIFSFDHYKSDNDYEIELGKNTRNPYDDKIEKRNSDNFYQNNFLLKLGYDYSKKFRFEFLNNNFSKKKYFPDAFNKITNTSYKTNKNSSTFKLIADQISNFYMNINLGYSLSDDTYEDPHGNVGSLYGLGKQKMNYITNDYNFQYYLEWLSNAYIFRFIFDLNREKYSQENTLSSKKAVCYRNNYSFGLNNTFFLLNNRINLMPGIRFAFIRDTNDTSLFKSKNNIFINEVEKKSYFNPQLGLKYQILKSLSLKSNIGKYFREPSFFERFGDRGHFQGNPELKAEEGVNFDIGLEIDLKNFYTNLNRFSLNTAYFQSNVNNIITPEYDSSGTGRWTNQSKGEIDGIELMLKISSFNIFSLILNAVWQDPVNIDEKLRKIDGENADYKKLSGRFRRSYLSRIEAKYIGFKTYFEYIRLTGIFYDSANILPRSGEGALKKEVNAGFSYNYNNMLFTIDLKNINNDQYDDFDFCGKYPNPGKTIFYSLKYKF